MKPRNFPARKNERRIRALERMRGEFFPNTARLKAIAITRDAIGDSNELREVRTKKSRA